MQLFVFYFISEEFIAPPEALRFSLMQPKEAQHMANRISRTTIVLIAAILALACLFVGVPKTEAASTPSHLIIINKATNKLAYYQNGSLVRTFSVATGRTQSLTPEGHFKVVNKIVNRPYYSGNIPGGDPRNPLAIAG